MEFGQHGLINISIMPTQKQTMVHLRSYNMPQPATIDWQHHLHLRPASIVFPCRFAVCAHIPSTVQGYHPSSINAMETVDYAKFYLW